MSNILINETIESTNSEAKNLPTKDYKIINKKNKTVVPFNLGLLR